MALGRKSVAVLVFVALVVVPAAIYVGIPGDRSGEPDGSGLDTLLRGMGFNPINPPSTLIGLGSVYQVSADGREYRTICPVDPALLAGNVVESPSTRTVAEQLRRASYTMEGKLARKISDKLGADSTESIHYSLTDVELLEVPLAVNRMIFATLTESPACKAEVDFELASGQFVCQGQTILSATADYDVRAASKETDSVQVRQAVSVVKAAIDANAKADSGTSGAKSVAGSGLHWGVKVNPVCIAPPHSRFARVLPRDRFDQVLNFVKFQILENVLPARRDQRPPTP